MTPDGPTVGTVHVNGVRVGYRESGDPAGPPVVLLHGSGSNARTWDTFLPRLTGYRMIAVDLRGHATSDRTRDYPLTGIRDDVVGLLVALDLQDVVLIGHSLGGYAALAAALEAPERISRLVLEDVAAPPRRAVPLGGIGPCRMLVIVAGILLARRDYHLRAVAAILRQLTRPDPGWWSRLGEVRQPTLVLSGGPASFIPPRRLTDVAAALQAARLVTIPIGHFVHSLAPERFADEVVAFLAEPAPSLAPAPRLG